MKKRGSLIVLSGPSGVGKGTIGNFLLNSHEDMCFSVSATTRAIRDGEAEGVNYFYKTREEFEEMIRNNEFLEYMQVFNQNYYGTPRAFVEQKLEEGMDVLLDIDVQGAMVVKKNYPDAVLIFLAPPSNEELYRRLVGRGTETIEAVNKRFAQAKTEFTYVKNYDYVVVNDDLNKAIEDVEAVIRAAELSSDRYKSAVYNCLNEAEEAE
ncbi:MAG: guanylate kinase [Clostridia bacterium]|nr:guanylate kinase [Clostridia bacterium]